MIAFVAMRTLTSAFGLVMPIARTTLALPSVLRPAAVSLAAMLHAVRSRPAKA